ncbi:hypothetical protein P175DRAFT_0444424 [Aspergillus ochraceoroseus IBT 24754]|uniref:Bul1 N-terminal domain-containing protein n=2 Tax=Aspergillus ochraceoroseus TaxID=138278 RepID=A0A2T5LP67_9EURO|nr:uncharacterized protein P175DRAFT_0444424 [Aspergillus ochraceoroseus IBT 24754]KKK13684.1 hypothetical protein AOCH_003346 [Aspergillus ochraceoroseus]PTU18079.1 hypothetical protein P175DRAFT_0444424 [Aspergillus ochraceoroseus IBT 24754]
MTASTLSRGSRSFEVFARLARPNITIELKHEAEGIAHSYTTGDQIQGTVIVTAEHLTSFDEIEIKLEGIQSVTVERGQIPGRSGAYQTFLRLRQPMEESTYPMPRVLEPGLTYKFPFTFVVPQRLLPHACSHDKKNVHLEHAHTLLPPTLGDPLLASDGRSLLDDLAPHMCRITYQVSADVIQKPVVGPPKSLQLVNKKIRIVPAVEEEPPLTVLDTDPVYCTRKEKDVRRGTMRPKLGRLVAAASQPKPVQLNPPNVEPCDSVSTCATIHLRFDPVGNETPPSLGIVWSKLRASTYAAASPWQDYPNTSSVSALGQMGQMVYTESVPLSTMCVESAQWTKHTIGDLIRRDSLQSTSSRESLTGPPPSSSFSGTAFYLASITVPVTLPKNKLFLPTFHSCLISRIYTLELCTSYHTPNMNILTPTVSLKLPIQFTSRPRPRATLTQLPEITQDEVNAEFFCPRSVAPPAATSLPDPAPPAYSGFLAPPQRRALPASSQPPTRQVRCQ